MVEEKTLSVAAYDFIFPKYFSPVPTDESKQEYLSFEKGDELPKDIVERCRIHAPEMVKDLTYFICSVLYSTDENIILNGILSN